MDTPRSSITETVGGSFPKIGDPIAGAKVTLFHQLENGKPVRNSVWHTSVVSDNSGRFELYDYATPGEKNLVGLEVSAPGYETAFTTYLDYSDPDVQYFLVVLRKPKP